MFVRPACYQGIIEELLSLQLGGHYIVLSRSAFTALVLGTHTSSLWHVKCFLGDAGI